MTQGSNYPLHITLPFDYNLFRDFRITFSQQGAIVITKTMNDFTPDAENGVAGTISLTQEDTYNFQTGKVEIQMHYLLTSGRTNSTNVVTMVVRSTADKEVFEID